MVARMSSALEVIRFLTNLSSLLRANVPLPRTTGTHVKRVRNVSTLEILLSQQPAIRDYVVTIDFPPPVAMMTMVMVMVRGFVNTSTKWQQPRDDLLVS